MNDLFGNDRPERKPRPWQPEPCEKARQRKLFSGLDCLLGQLDLFQTDGQDEEEPEQ